RRRGAQPHRRGRLYRQGNLAAQTPLRLRFRPPPAEGRRGPLEGGVRQDGPQRRGSGRHLLPQRGAHLRDREVGWRTASSPTPLQGGSGGGDTNHLALHLGRPPPPAGPSPQGGGTTEPHLPAPAAPSSPSPLRGGDRGGGTIRPARRVLLPPFGPGHPPLKG